jgi:hypothetical protein
MIDSKRMRYTIYGLLLLRQGFYRFNPIASLIHHECKEHFPHLSVKYTY